MPKARGRGIAEFALRCIIKRLCESYGVISVWVGPDEGNGSAKKLYKKTGFLEEIFPKYLQEEDNGKHIYTELVLPNLQI